jgi:uncharacterized membrane protein YedE/YeeE
MWPGSTFGAITGGDVGLSRDRNCYDVRRSSRLWSLLMSKYLGIIIAGLLFGIGLAVSEMTHASKVLGFLDVAGNWDPSLMFVLGGAVGVAIVAFRFILKQPVPVLEDRFHLPIAKSIDKPLVFGAAIFGVGWGISGYCPGPGVALLAAPGWETWVFIPAMLLGALLHKASTSTDGQGAAVLQQPGPEQG